MTRGWDLKTRTKTEVRGSNQYVRSGTQRPDGQVDPATRAQIIAAADDGAAEEAAFWFSDESAAWRELGFGWSEREAWMSDGGTLMDARNWRDFGDATNEHSVDSYVANSPGVMVKAFVLTMSANVLTVSTDDETKRVVVSTSKDAVVAEAESFAAAHWDNETLGDQPGCRPLAALWFFETGGFAELTAVMSDPTVESDDGRIVIFAEDGIVVVLSASTASETHQALAGYVAENWYRTSAGDPPDDEQDMIDEFFGYTFGDSYTTDSEWCGP